VLAAGRVNRCACEKWPKMWPNPFLSSKLTHNVMYRGEKCFYLFYFYHFQKLQTTNIRPIWSPWQPTSLPLTPFRISSLEAKLIKSFHVGF
jgi:hypothetical protein